MNKLGAKITKSITQIFIYSPEMISTRLGSQSAALTGSERLNIHFESEKCGLKKIWKILFRCLKIIFEYLKKIFIFQFDRSGYSDFHSVQSLSLGNYLNLKKKGSTENTVLEIKNTKQLKIRLEHVKLYKSVSATFRKLDFANTQQFQNFNSLFFCVSDQISEPVCIKKTFSWFKRAEAVAHGCSANHVASNRVSQYANRGNLCFHWPHWASVNTVGVFMPYFLSVLLLDVDATVQFALRHVHVS